MTAYIWELGIDWNAIETAGKSYLRQGFVNPWPPPAMARWALQKDDTITFVIFDVTSSEVISAQVDKIESFAILSEAAVNGQSIGNPLNSLQPTIAPTPDSPTAQSTVFRNVLRSWTSNPQAVTVPDASATYRFLLTLQMQAQGPTGASRVFAHDPEMVVGPNG